MSGSRRLDCDEITQVTWRRRLEELIRGRNSFVFNAFVYLEPVERFENTVRIGEPGSCNTSTSNIIRDSCLIKFINKMQCACPLVNNIGDSLVQLVPVLSYIACVCVTC